MRTSVTCLPEIGPPPLADLMPRPDAPHRALARTCRDPAKAAQRSALRLRQPGVFAQSGVNAALLRRAATFTDPDGRRNAPGSTARLLGMPPGVADQHRGFPSGPSARRTGAGNRAEQDDLRAATRAFGTAVRRAESAIRRHARLEVGVPLGDCAGRRPVREIRRYACCLRNAARSQQRYRTGNSVFRLMARPACPPCGQFAVKTARRFVLGRPRRGSGCRVRRPGAACPGR